jgi:hypothetical protein
MRSALATPKANKGIAANLRLAAVKFIVFHRRLLWLRHPSQVAGFCR